MIAARTETAQPFPAPPALPPPPADPLPGTHLYLLQNSRLGLPAQVPIWEPGFLIGNHQNALGLRAELRQTRVGSRCSGKERDVETGLDFFGARYLSSAQGRFTGADAVFADQHAGDPQTLNVYSYALNNPLRFIDDEGFSAVDRVNRATGALGKPYGGTGPDSYDCSGLAGYSAGTDVPGGLPRTAEQQYLFASNHSVFTTNPDQVRPGDEVYFQDGNGDVKHVGVVVSVDPKTGVITMVHAAGRAKGVVRATLTRTKVGSAFGSQTIKGYGLWHNYDRTQTGHPSTSPSVYDRVLSWWHSLSLFGESSSQPSSKPNPEGHPHRHKTPPCLKNADGRCVG